MAGFGQYLKDTQGELRHVAWPTRTQTIVYTVLVAAISVGVALYLGLFDYIFTAAVARIVNVKPASQGAIQVTQNPAATSSTDSSASLALPSASSTQ